MAKAPVVNDEQTPAPKSGNKLVMILMIVIILLLLAVVAVGALLLLKKPATDAGAAAPAATEQKADAHDAKASDGHGDAKAGAPVTIPLGQPVTVNLAAPNDAKLLQVEMDMVTYSHTADAAVKTNRAEIINNIMLVLSGVNAANLRTREGKEALQKELKDAINSVLEKRANLKNAIDDVYFTKLLMQ
ncbi:MAG: flagellar basal body-associated FliL family protein [Halothiobacillus sp.]